ncbi:hypothetical protein HLRTI_001148 [Halorhabdus tiamatea SARL4B]|uniref:Uncharacterized protein n=1 Tax=Halorhabdus tiamatea SARL4B TaxID=1033806 RepID=U2DLU0_9EURY|nr:hypothetical protein [Halorhabdus tiamatea]ERJ06732.1 hypothetical protein HLRTI_001148 [Halorhabdus tiamatea SARL4B]
MCGRPAPVLAVFVLFVYVVTITVAVGFVLPILVQVLITVAVLVANLGRAAVVGLVVVRTGVFGWPTTVVVFVGLVTVAIAVRFVLGVHVRIAVAILVARL